MLKVVQGRLQKHVNQEFPEVHTVLRKGRGTLYQIANIHFLIEEFQTNFREKKIYLCFINYTKAFDCVDHKKLWKIVDDGNTRSPYLPPEKPIWRSTATIRTWHGTTDWLKIGKGKEYRKDVSCHPVYLTYMQSTLCEMPNWIELKLESKSLGKI